MDMLLIFLWLLATTLKGTSGAEQETLCTSNTCFTVHLTKVSFQVARQNCEHSGGYLMTVRDREEENVLRCVLSKIQRQRQDRANIFWIGLKLHKGDCVLADETLRGFRWISGEEDSSYSNWKKEPAKTCTSERCVSVLYTLSGENQLQWTARQCATSGFYVCKFYFKGMCKSLTLMGPGQISYTAPFSDRPQSYKMQLLPFGTYADISCRDQQSHLSLCRETEHGYQWTNPGPFCKAERQNCMVHNGGCEHLCQQEAGGVRCFCKEGYRLGEDGFSCGSADECRGEACERQCAVEEPEHSCECLGGSKLEENRHICTDNDEHRVDGRCSQAVDECEQLRCHHGCSNSSGSLSCYCQRGFSLSEDGRSCVDVNECADGVCPFHCVNTEGSFRCACQRGFHADVDGVTCIPEMTGAAPPDGQTEVETDESVVTEPLTRSTVEPQRQSPPVSVPVNVSHGVQQSNDSLSASLAEAANSRLLICVLGSVIPLMLLVAVTLAIAIFRCHQSKKEAKKNVTTDGYCWVSPGLDPRLEKLYESILTDDL